jgi:hypothetical protein
LRKVSFQILGKTAHVNQTSKVTDRRGIDDELNGEGFLSAGIL